MGNTIYLIGFMGAGKSSLAKEIAEQYDYTLIDTDTLIEQQEKRSIENIFDIEGELYFRKVESEILRSIKSSTKTIVSTGGGLPCYNNNMNWMNNNGVTLYLKHSNEELKKRLQNDIKSRPLLKTRVKMTLSAHIEDLMQHRRPYYEQAKFAILSSEISPQTIINTATQ